MHEEAGSPTEWQRNRLGGAPKRSKPRSGSPTFTRYPEENLTGMSRAYPAEHHPVPEVLSGGCPRAMPLPEDGEQRAVLLGMSFCPGLNAAQHLWLMRKLISSTGSTRSAAQARGAGHGPRQFR
jgi:hypothetical protein